MDVRCEKCGTEYELDEARLKPGGVTVKCTNCGHMFKIRKRAPTNVGAAPEPPRTRAASTQRPTTASTGVPVRPPTQDSGRQRAADSGRVMKDDGGDRVWIIRYDNGEQRTCRELATLQQWIVSGTVTRESMISRTGKTWKRLGDIAELSSFFIVADEARQQRMGRDSGRVTAPVQAPRAAPASSDEPVRTTQVGVASGPKPVAQTKARDEITQAAVPRSMADAGARPAAAPSKPASLAPLASTTATGLPPIPQPVVGRPPTGAPPNAPARLGSLPAQPPGMKPAVQQTTPATPAARRPATRPPTTPPVTVPVVIAPVAHAPAHAHGPAPAPVAPHAAAAAPPPRNQSTPPPIRSAMPVPPSERRTGAWANEQVRPLDDRSSGEWVAPDDVRLEEEVGPRGPVAGKLSAIVDEPAFTGGGFSGTNRNKPASDAAFMQGPGPSAEAAPRIVFDDDDSEPVAMPRGAGAGKWIAIGSILLIGGAAIGIYFGVIRGGGGGSGSGTGTGTGTGSAVAAVVIDAGVAAPVAPPDAAPVVPAADDPIAIARDALVADVGARIDEAQKKLAADESKPGALALEARLVTALAQALDDRAALEADKKSGAELHKQSQQKLLDAVRLAQRAQKAQPGDITAAVAMADILRLQGKVARDIKRYLDPGIAAKDRDARLVAAMILIRDGKRDAARADLEKLDSGDGAMERTGDVRARFRRAMIAYAAGDGATAKQLAQDVIALQPEHEGAKALLARVVDRVASGDPLPPEDHVDAGVPVTPSGSGTGTGTGTAGVPVDIGYAAALAKANTFAEDGDCGHAMEFYQKALAAKPTSVEALTGAGFCYIDTKQFASAHSSFRTALSISSRYERALWGIAEAYQQQGLAEKAIEAYQRYLEAYPDSAAAKKQLERLGAGSGGGGGGSGGSAGGSANGSDGGSGSAGSSSEPGGGSAGSSGSGAGTASGTGNDPFGGN